MDAVGWGNLATRNSKQLLPSGPTHLQPLPVCQTHRSFAASLAEDLLDSIHIDDDRAVNPYKLRRVKGLGKLFNGLPQHEALRADMQAAVVVRRLDPFDFVDV